MGSLSIPSSGGVYLDANCIVYRVERIEPYQSFLQPLFDAARRGAIELVTSELSLIECLVKPVRTGDEELERLFRAVLTGSKEIRLAATSTAIIESAIHFRARQGFKTPDAIHVATAMETGCSSIVTNDEYFRSLSAIQVQLLGDVSA